MPRSVVSVANGSGPTQAAGVEGVAGATGAAGADEPGGNIPGGNQPPFQHVPPPIEANGLTVTHGLFPAGGAAGVLGVVGPDGAGNPIDGDVPTGAVFGGVIPGGSQPPL
jgi:hypothetical protein